MDQRQQFVVGESKRLVRPPRKLVLMPICVSNTETASGRSKSLDLHTRERPEIFVSDPLQILSETNAVVEQTETRIAEHVHSSDPALFRTECPAVLTAVFAETGHNTATRVVPSVRDGSLTRQRQKHRFMGWDMHPSQLLLIAFSVEVCMPAPSRNVKLTCARG
jgi:hypothetical protein